MLAKVTSCSLQGVDGLLIRVEVDLAQGLPSFSTVGLAEGAVREAKDRVRAAIKNSGYEFPPRRITVNLAPAAVKKEGTGYDLPIAIGILSASGPLAGVDLSTIAITGELSLDGTVKPVPGILSMALAARNNGITQLLVPAENAPEAAIVNGLEVFGLHRLEEVVQFLRKEMAVMPVHTDPADLFHECNGYPVDFAEVKGQEHVKRACEIAAAGGHNLLLSGIPGTGKTMMAKRLPTILPALTLEEAIETTKIFSTTALLPQTSPLLTTRPFRSPHHTISDAGLIGGGQTPRPGEVSLAHNGVLFLDELPEFKKHVLEVLRQPLEDGVVTIARATTSLRFPARFMLVAAMNPCPCGYFGDQIRACTCSPVQIQRYRSRLSGPLLDRIDMHIEVPAVPVSKLLEQPQGESSQTIRQRVNRARLRQQQRFAAIAHIYGNAQMGSREMKHFCPLDQATCRLLEQAITSLGLSARAYTRIIKIARTIADLAECTEINTKHLAEAIQYRRSQYDL